MVSSSAVQFHLSKTLFSGPGLENILNNNPALLSKLMGGNNQNQNQEQMQSGLIPRFLILMLEPVRTPIEELGKGNQSGFKEELRETFPPINPTNSSRQRVEVCH